MIFHIFRKLSERAREEERERKRGDEVERDRVTERKRRTAGDKTESESEGGKGGEDKEGYTVTCYAPIHCVSQQWHGKG